MSRYKTEEDLVFPVNIMHKSLHLKVCLLIAAYDALRGSPSMALINHPPSKHHYINVKVCPETVEVLLSPAASINTVIKLTVAVTMDMKVSKANFLCLCHTHQKYEGEIL